MKEVLNGSSESMDQRSTMQFSRHQDRISIAEEVRDRIIALPSEGQLINERTINDLELATNILDSIEGLSIEDKRSILGYFVWERGGKVALAIELLGIKSAAAFHSLMDKVVEEPSLLVRYSLFKDKFTQESIDEQEFMALIREGLTYLDVGREMEIDETTAYRIYIKLIRKGKLRALPQGRYSSNRFKKFRNKVKRIRKKKKVLNRDVAKVLKRSIRSVEEAVSSLEGEIEPLTRSDVERLKTKEGTTMRGRVEDLILNTNFSNREIADTLGISKFSVENYAAALRKQGRVPNRHDEKIEALKLELERELGQHLMIYGTETPINLTALIRKGRLKGNIRTIVKLYNQISRTKRVPFYGKSTSNQKN